MRWFAVAIVLPLGLALPVSAAAQPAAPVVQCTVGDERVAELSGLAADADHWYAVNDGGTDSSVFVLTKDCAVESVITGDTDPYDVEDLARAADGTFWLADAGDNDSDRETVALISLTPDGDSTVHRLTYPDGAHDSEAVFLDGAGTPYLVTKNPLGVAEVYRPAGPLASPGPTALEHVASVQITPTDTQGGPVPEIVGSVTVTGGASMVDGSVIALRTYTDAYLYAVSDGDVVAALATEPVRVPLPDEAQGRRSRSTRTGRWCRRRSWWASRSGWSPGPPTCSPPNRRPARPRAVAETRRRPGAATGRETMTVYLPYRPPR